MDRIREAREELSTVPELSRTQRELVARHLLSALQQRKEAMKALIPRPSDDDGDALAAWEHRRDEIEDALAVQAQAERLRSIGLQAAWETYEERERLQEMLRELQSHHFACPDPADQPAMGHQVVGVPLAQQQPVAQQQQSQAQLQEVPPAVQKMVQAWNIAEADEDKMELLETKRRRPSSFFVCCGGTQRFFVFDPDTFAL